MAPKKRTKKEEEEEEDYDSDFIDDDGNGKPAKKKPAKTAKTKADPKPKAPKPPKIIEPTTLSDGWTAHPPSLLYRNAGSPKVSKVAAFDFDGTLVVTRSGSEFPLDANDWRFYNSEVPKKLKQYHEKGYRIVIISNQGGVKSALAGAMSEKVRGRVAGFTNAVQVPWAAVMATLPDSYRKPERGMWDVLCEKLSDGVQPDVAASFFVGDGSDESSKVGDSDRRFAAAVGLSYRDVKEEFGEPETSSQGGSGGGGSGGGGVNADIINIFESLRDFHKDDKFKSAAYGKAAVSLATFPGKIVNDKAVLKEVSALKGVGKGSMDVIKEFLSTGKIERLAEIPQEKVKEVSESKSKARSEALQFM